MNDQELTTSELNDLMKESAQDAINYIRNEHGHEVTLRQEDLAVIDLVLTKIYTQHVQEPLSNSDMFTICNILGAFVGEVFKNLVGGEWFMDTSLPDAPYVVLNYAGKSYPFASMCFEKIAKTPEVSLAKYFELAIGNSTQ